MAAPTDSFPSKAHCSSYYSYHRSPDQSLFLCGLTHTLTKCSTIRPSFHTLSSPFFFAARHLFVRFDNHASPHAIRAGKRYCVHHIGKVKIRWGECCISFSCHWNGKINYQQSINSTRNTKSLCLLLVNAQSDLRSLLLGQNSPLTKTVHYHESPPLSKNTPSPPKDASAIRLILSGR
jgi:hypothetical protein